jgi:hypothetical protein
VTMPVDGAIVGIMRDKSWAADPIVTEVRTGSDGSFSAQVHAKDVDTYYAKLFLNDKQGVFLHDWWTRSVREYNSATRGKNETAAIDLGGTNVSRDGGRGTPECAIWEGGHRAWQEYVSTTGQRPLIGEHGNYQITMESTDSGIVWTSRDTTHWEVNYPTAEFSDDISAPANPQQLLMPTCSSCMARTSTNLVMLSAIPRTEATITSTGMRRVSFMATAIACVTAVRRAFGTMPVTVSTKAGPTIGKELTPIASNGALIRVQKPTTLIRKPPLPMILTVYRVP